MTNPDQSPEPPQSAPRRYVWPWFLAAAVILAFVLAVLWMSREVERTRRIRDANLPAQDSR